MPYSGPSDSSLPDYIKKLSNAKRKQWVAIWNKTKGQGKDESEAFRLANGVVLGKHASEIIAMADKAKQQQGQKDDTKKDKSADTDIDDDDADEMSEGMEDEEYSEDDDEMYAEAQTDDDEDSESEPDDDEDDNATPAKKKKAGEQRKFAKWSTSHKNDLPDSAFLYISPGGSKDSDGKTTPRSLRHFPVRGADGALDANHIRNALARIPDSDVPAGVKSRLTAKAQGLLKEVDKSAAEPGTNDVHVNQPLGNKKKKGRGVVYLQRMVDQMKSNFTDEQYAEMMRRARSHAGGKGRVQQMQSYSYYDSDIEGINEPMAAYDIDCVTEHYEKADKRVKYRKAASAEQRCGMCAFYDDDGDADNALGPCCQLVEGVINENYVCDLFLADNDADDDEDEMVASEIVELCAYGENSEFCLFNEVDFAEIPKWIPFLPKPGEYTHPEYGKIQITKERNQRFVQNFKDGIYQKNLPVDIEHKLSMSGAVAWINDMRINKDGSSDAKVEWNDRGKSLVEADRFKYFSPAWYDSWEDPATNKTYKDVAIGGAITTRPFFKDAHLRPLVANEHGLFYVNPVKPDKSKGGTMPDKKDEKTTAEAQVVDATAFTELQSKFSEQEKKFAEQERAMKAMSEAAEAKDKEIKSMSEKMQAQEKAARTKRFTEEVKGKTENGIAWVGKHEDHIEFLESLADSFGEDSKQIKTYMEQQRSHAHQLEEAGLFSEVGSNASGKTASVTEQIQAAADKIREAKPNISKERAFTEALEANPKLYEAYERGEA